MAFPAPHITGALDEPFESFEVRRADEADLAGVQRLLSEAAGRLRARGIDQWPDPFPMERIRTGFERGIVLVVRDGERLVATQSVAFDDPLWADRPGDALYAHRLAVAPGYRGLGAAVLSGTELMAEQLECTRIRLDCVATNQRLRAYYEAAGYEARGERSGPGWTVALYEKPLGRRPST
jgi:ribosomal protein S18 acetylase RimI-like enzyme